MIKSRHDIEQRGFSAATWAENGQKLVLTYFKIDPVEGDNLLLPPDIELGETEKIGVKLKGLSQTLPKSSAPKLQTLPH